MSYCSAIVKWKLSVNAVMQKINALSCSKPIKFAIDHLYDFSHNLLNLLNILSRTIRLPQSFISKRSRNKQRLFRRDLETSKSRGCFRRSYHYNFNSGYFWRRIFLSMFMKLFRRYITWNRQSAQTYKRLDSQLPFSTSFEPKAVPS